MSDEPKREEEMEAIKGYVDYTITNLDGLKVNEDPKPIYEKVQMMCYPATFTRRNRRLTARVFRRILKQYENDNKVIFVCVRDEFFPAQTSSAKF